MDIMDGINAKIKKALIEARALIEDSKHWTQGANARDSYGRIIMQNSPNACLFCANGALLKICQDTLPIAHVISYLDREIVENGHQSLFSYNDTHTHSEVLKLFDQAIAKL
jgi:hypothetical protein